MSDNEMWDLVYLINLARGSGAKDAADAADEALAVRAGQG